MEDSFYYNRQDKYLANFIVGYYFVQALNLLIKLVVGNFALWPFISRGALIILLLFALRPMILRKFGAFIGTEIIFVLLFSYTFIFRYASFSEKSSIVLNVFTVFIPMAIATISINNVRILLKHLYVMAWPTQIILLYVLVTRNSFQYSMVGGYTLVFQMLIVFDHFTEKHKWYDLLACILDLLVVFVYGSRGPILCICTFIVIRILFNSSISKARKTVLVLFTCILLAIVVFFYDSIINSLITLAERLGYSSRNIYLLINGRITSDSGRNSIHSFYLDEVKNGSIIGHGIAGGWRPDGSYPHNIFLELLVSFGPIFGIIACILVICISFFAINCKDEDRGRLCHILFAFSINLLLSSTFLESPMFFMLMGMGFQSIPIKLILGKRGRVSR